MFRAVRAATKRPPLPEGTVRTARDRCQTKTVTAARHSPEPPEPTEPTEPCCALTRNGRRTRGGLAAESRRTRGGITADSCALTAEPRRNRGGDVTTNGPPVRRARETPLGGAAGRAAGVVRSSALIGPACRPNDGHVVHTTDDNVATGDRNGCAHSSQFSYRRPLF